MCNQQAPMLVGLVDPISVHSPPSQPVVDTVGSLIPTRQMRPLRLGEGLGVNIATLTELLLGPRRGARNFGHVICDLQSSPTKLRA